ncbi:MAG: polysaccharide biosynthesis protein [Bacteroidales bacterium]|nr:polysaccharide biosynthesis protein [Bacteroidales bacterium]
MHPLKQLAGQTAVYGLGTIVPRLLNYLLVPLYTRIFFEAEYGIITELYAYIAFFFVLLLYGMETTFFRFAEKENDPVKIFSTSLITVSATSMLFVLLVVMFINPISFAIHYEDQKRLLIYSAIIVALDAFTAIQFAYLRQQQKSLRFSLIKIVNVGVNVGMNLYYLLFCNSIYQTDPGSPWLILYNPDLKIEYVFISNLVASLVSIVLLSPQLFRLGWKFDLHILRQMLRYTFPLLIVGLAGMINEVSDKIIFKYLVKIPEGTSDPQNYVLSQLGIYGANFKLAVLMTIFIQMFRYAAEPFFFAQAKEANAKTVYADVMKYFTIFGLIIFLAVTLYIDIFKYFIGPEYWEGLYIVPIVLMANLLLGIFYNLSVWYKLNDITKFGALIAVFGSLITIAVNFLLVPTFSYLGSALGHLICYIAMILLSYYLGKKYFPIDYHVGRIGFYFGLAIVLFFAGYLTDSLYENLRLVINSLFFLVFIVTAISLERKHFIKPKQN